MMKPTLMASVSWNKGMRPDIYTTGLTAAISRGDAAVALFCFDRIEANLDYVITSAVLEQCWYLIREWIGVRPDPEGYRNFVIRMALSPTNKDASALFRLAVDGIPDAERHKELVLASKIGITEPDKGIALFERTSKRGFKRPLTKYEQVAFDFLLEKAKGADFLTTKWLALMACTLIVTRGLSGLPKVRIPEKEPRVNKLPYWCCWFGTEQGKEALEQFAKDSPLDIPSIKWCWWVFESEYVPPGKAVFPESGKEDFSCVEMAWWNTYLNTRLDDNMIEIWMEEKSRLKQIINKLL